MPRNPKKRSGEARNRMRVLLPNDPHKLDVGMDDSGRSSIAGPLVLAALWHPEPRYLQYIGATDSKRTTPAERDLFVRKLERDARAKIGYATASPEWIDRCGVNQAEAYAVRSAFDQLALDLEVSYDDLRLLIDGGKSFPNLPTNLETHYLPGGDGYQPLIAAASMCARAMYDKLIRELHEQDPDWLLLKHWGAPTDEHRQLIYERGLKPWHRRKTAMSAVATYALKHRIRFPTWMTGDCPEEAS